MGKRLIIAEKPSQAREYAQALGVGNRGDGYLENEQYVITWCFGHLLELERPEAYMNLDQVGKRWSLNRLPVLPPTNEFRRTVKAGAAKQYQVVQRWLKSSEIQEVICGTDADREGQLLFQELWEASRCQKPLARLWISSLTTASIREGMKQLRSAGSMAGLTAAGNGRAYADWDFGMNLTEGFTSLFGSFDTARKKPNVISIGRVQTPTLALIVEREWEIERFVPQPFFEVRAEFSTALGEYQGKWFDFQDETRRLTKLEEAEKIVTKTKNKAADIAKLTRKDVQEPPPLLFDLTSLTIAASKKYGFSAEKVLQVAQSLYEKKGITYPRTDCVYLSEDLIPKLPAHLNALRQEPYIGFAEEAGRYGVPKGSRVINTISAHHAIIPTTEKIPLARLTIDEQKLYDLIARRFLAVWFPSARYAQTDVITVVEEEHFRTRGKVLLSSGWKAVYSLEEKEDKGVEKAIKRKTKRKDELESREEENVALPPLNPGQKVSTKRVFIEEKSTKPPQRYTQGDLLKAMEGAGKQIDDEILRQQLKGKGLGTVATRPAIIENLIERGYILQDKKALKPALKGSELIRLIKERLPKAQLLISAEMTGQMEFNLSKVEKGQQTLEQFMAEVETAIQQIINELRSFERQHGKVPLALAPKQQSKRAEKEAGGPKTTKALGAKVSRVKKADDNTAMKSPSEALGKCPRCGCEVIEGEKGFGCSNWRNGCRFVVWKKQLCGKTITPHQMKCLLKKGKTPLIKGFKSSTGKTFAAHLVWENPVEGKLKFEFKTSTQ
ncbi:DNA topoisomerase 3 [Desulfosporosinus sp. PR]|uniref:type IA DNA topoisomerase n=1 Tax=Candidatus Desulfosporosinus nitrosoreducens TaxID=3401928 RepID=UPI0027E82F5D|nr:DNA topoisomerase 3 [Desulfosporosinus sp. PR]MDQ7094522.1 DNA topoisomerase 3 [Desulfosporosinus sp. PR]